MMDLFHHYFSVNFFVFLIYGCFITHASANPLKTQYNYGNGPWNGDDDNDMGENSAGTGNGDINSLADADTIVIPILTKPELEAKFRKNRFVIFPMAFVSLQ